MYYAIYRIWARKRPSCDRGHDIVRNLWCQYTCTTLISTRRRAFWEELQQHSTSRQLHDEYENLGQSHLFTLWIKLNYLNFIKEVNLGLRTFAGSVCFCCKTLQNIVLYNFVPNNVEGVNRVNRCHTTSLVLQLNMNARLKLPNYNRWTTKNSWSVV